MYGVFRNGYPVGLVNDFLAAKRLADAAAERPSDLMLIKEMVEGRTLSLFSQKISIRL